VIQVVLSQRLERRTVAPAFEVYRALRQVNPSPYMYYLRLPGHAGERRRGTAIVGTSPEILVRVEDGRVEYRPIAGTRWRGRDEAHDQACPLYPSDAADDLLCVDLGGRRIVKTK